MGLSIVFKNRSLCNCRGVELVLSTRFLLFIYFKEEILLFSMGVLNCSKFKVKTFTLSQ